MNRYRLIYYYSKLYGMVWYGMVSDSGKPQER